MHKYHTFIQTIVALLCLAIAILGMEDNSQSQIDKCGYNSERDAQECVILIDVKLSARRLQEKTEKPST